MEESGQAYALAILLPRQTASDTYWI